MGRRRSRAAFDRAIGLRPESATALWGGAVAHAEIGNKVVAQNYLRRWVTLHPEDAETKRMLEGEPAGKTPAAPAQPSTP
jgi:hypothetical protein